MLVATGQWIITGCRDLIVHRLLPGPVAVSITSINP
jgi:hypothetical protein